jgi:hypothetical protein
VDLSTEPEVAEVNEHNLNAPHTSNNDEWWVQHNKREHPSF